jgi:hypothetical protein
MRSSPQHDLDEYVIRDRKRRARLNVWGVGSRLITSENNPSRSAAVSKR